MDENEQILCDYEKGVRLELLKQALDNHYFNKKRNVLTANLYRVIKESVGLD